MNSIGKTKKLNLLVVFFLFSFFSIVLAQGLVPCGNTPDDPCSFEDLFELVNNVIDFTLFKLVPPLAIVWFAFGGITMMTAGGDPSKIETGKRMITYGIIGVLLVYLAWFIVYEFVNWMTDGNPWPLNFFEEPSS